MPERSCYQLTTTPILHPALLFWQVDEIEELGVKLSLGRGERWRLLCL